jgi:L-threonylcarbamoyladenylate synthase
MNKEFLVWTGQHDIKLVAGELKRGRVVLGASDTVLGLLAAVSEQGVLALNAIKGRADKPYIVLIGQKSRINDFSDSLAIGTQKLIECCWPGPLTLILKAKTTADSYVRGPQGTVGIRMPAHDGLLTLLQEVPALFSTSANHAGRTVPSCLEDVEPDIIKNVSAVIMDDYHAHCASVIPSTIIDCTGPQLKVVREGAYAIATLEAIVGQKFVRS